MIPARRDSLVVLQSKVGSAAHNGGGVRVLLILNDLRKIIRARKRGEQDSSMSCCCVGGAHLVVAGEERGGRDKLVGALDPQRLCEAIALSVGKRRYDMEEAMTH